LDKIIYYNNQKGTVKERINDTQYRVSFANDKKQGIMDYDEIIRQLTHIDNEGDKRWEIEEILDHKWDPKKKGRLLILIEWKALEEPSWEPMHIIKEDDPITLAEYARDHNRLDQTKWKWAKRYLQLTKRSINHLTKLCAKKKKSGPKIPVWRTSSKNCEGSLQN
jgi:hypothetical protein